MLSGQLAHLLGQDVGLTPELVEINVAPELREGILDARFIQSRSIAHYYYMVRTAHGWQHADGRCRGWVIRGECAHVKELNMETGVVQSNARVLALIDEIEDAEIADSIRGDLTETWVYEFPVGGKNVVGVSSKGVENGCRELAKQGEAIREMDVKVEYEDDREARFVAQAGRYAISPDGKEVLLDVAIRAKRQSKWETRRNGDVVPDDNWYEKGITKAARNAKLALMPDSVVALIITEAKKQGRTRAVNAPQDRRQVQAPRHPMAQPEPEPDGVEDVPASPSGLLNAIAKAHGNAVMFQAKGIMAHLYGVDDFLKLKTADHKDYVEKLKVWLLEPDHEHTPADAPDGSVICGRCGLKADGPPVEPSGEQAGLPV
jgi:hypothetical protein